MASKIEELFFSEGLKCVVILTSMGHRCGYVGVEPDHQLYGVTDYFDLALNVHGGITYSENGENTGYPTNQVDPIWWFGFDCTHLGDAPDFNELKKILPAQKFKKLHDYISHIRYSGDTVRLKQYVVNECKLLAKQLEELACDAMSRNYSA